MNYTFFLQAIRDALDALGQAKGRYFPLTAALPCGPDKIEKIQVDKIKDILDELVSSTVDTLTYYAVFRTTKTHVCISTQELDELRSPRCLGCTNGDQRSHV